MINGTKVIRKGEGRKHVGTIVEQYVDNMVNIRFPGGIACADVKDLTEVFWSNELKAYVTIPEVY